MKKGQQFEIDKFVEIWMDAVSNGLKAQDIYEVLKFKSKQQLADRASYLRKLGLNLPRLNIGLKGRKKRLREANKLLNKLELSL